MKRITISKEFRFEASHVLPRHPGKCARLHGHSWVLTVGVSGLVNPETGFVVDYGELRRIVDVHVIEKLDHTHLGCGVATREGNVTGERELFHPYFGATFYPSSENLVLAIARLLAPLVPEIAGYRIPDGPCQGLELEFVRLNETCTSQAEWRKE